MSQNKVFHTFNVTHKVNLTIQQAFEVAQDIVEDVSTTLRAEWPKRTELRLKDFTTDANGVRTYAFQVIEV